MMFKKTKEIWNLRAKIENRDKFIDKQAQENSVLRFENEEHRDTERHIKNLISNYEVNKTNPFTLIRDIKKELDKTPIQY